jgi:hypothetical protein
MLTVVPSDTVKDLLRQGKRSQAIQLYRQEGASRTDINYLNTADSIATDRGISLDEAFAGIIDHAPLSTSQPAGVVTLTSNALATGRGSFALRCLGCFSLLLGGIVGLFTLVILRATADMTFSCDPSGDPSGEFGCREPLTTGDVLVIVISGLVAVSLLAAGIWAWYRASHRRVEIEIGSISVDPGATFKDLD